MDMLDQTFGSANSPDIYFDYIYNHEQDTTQNIKVPYPVIFFIYSGKLIIRYKDKRIAVKKGDCVFIQANTTASFDKKNYDEEIFCGIYIGFNKAFLSEFYYQYYNKKTAPQKDKFPADIIKIPCTSYMKSLYISMIPYFEQKIKPEKNILELKRMECIYCMLTCDPRFYTSLFNFIKPIKQNIFYILYNHSDSNLN